MPKKTWLILAWSWTIIIAVLCLVSFKEFPTVRVANADKYVHGIMHFLFVVLWYQYYRRSRGLPRLWLLGKSLLYSVLYGCLIEVAQECCCTTRMADLRDVLANFIGAFAGVLLLWALDYNREINQE